MNRLARFVALLWLAAIAAFTLPAVAQSDLRIGFVNREKILRDSPAAARSDKKLQAEFERRTSELKGMADRINDIQRAIDRGGLTMPEAERRVKDRDLAALTRDFQRMQRELREDMDLRGNEELRSLADRANKIIQRIAEKEKYDVILQDAVYVSSKIDLTDRVIKEMGE